MSELTFITGNQNKADFLAKWLGHPIKHHKLDLDELQSLDLHEVVKHKALQAYEILKQPVLVEDATLRFTGMGRLPGTFIKWFIEELGYDGLMRLANSLPSQEAVGVVCYAFCDGKKVHFFEGEMRGHIGKEARGSGGFGFDPIFINDGYKQTRAEMDEEAYYATSYRTPAIEKLRAYLEISQVDIAVERIMLERVRAQPGDGLYTPLLPDFCLPLSGGRAWSQPKEKMSKYSPSSFKRLSPENELAQAV